MDDPAATLALGRRLAERLERLSVDSIYARRASGSRGNLLRCLEQSEAGDTAALERLPALIAYGYEVLTRAAREIPAG